MTQWRRFKEWLLDWWQACLVGFVIGLFFGAVIEADAVFKDCRYAGVVRLGESAFKCEQFSRVVLLTPDEQAKKDKKQ